MHVYTLALLLHLSNTSFVYLADDCWNNLLLRPITSPGDTKLFSEVDCNMFNLNIGKLVF